MVLQKLTVQDAVCGSTEGVVSSFCVGFILEKVAKPLLRSFRCWNSRGPTALFSPPAGPWGASTPTSPGHDVWVTVAAPSQGGQGLTAALWGLHSGLLCCVECECWNH